MIQILLTSLSLVAPLLLLVLAGAILKKLGFISDPTISEISKIVLKLLLPIKIFLNIYNGKLDSNLSGRYVFVLVGSYVISVIINTIILHIRNIDTKQKSAILQNATRANISIFALPLTILIAGETISPLVAVSVGIMTPITNGYAIAEFEYYEPGECSKLKVLYRIITSPIVLGAILGFVFKGFNITLPSIIAKTFSEMANCVNGMSLILVGASFKLAFNKKDLFNTIYTISYKTIVCPLIAILLGVFFKLNPEQMIVIMCISSAPIATSCFPTANGYDTDIDLVSSTLVYSYIVCGFTITLIISILRVLCLI